MVQVWNDGPRPLSALTKTSDIPADPATSPSTTVAFRPASAKFLKFMHSKKKQSRSDPESISSSLTERTKHHLDRAKALIDFGRGDAENTDDVPAVSIRYTTNESITGQEKQKPMSLFARKKSLVKRFEERENFRMFHPVHLVSSEKITEERDSSPDTNDEKKEQRDDEDDVSTEVSTDLSSVHWDTQSVIHEQTRIRGILEDRLGAGYINRVREISSDTSTRSSYVVEAGEVHHDETMDNAPNEGESKREVRDSVEKVHENSVPAKELRLRPILEDMLLMSTKASKSQYFKDEETVQQETVIQEEVTSKEETGNQEEEEAGSHKETVEKKEIVDHEDTVDYDEADLKSRLSTHEKTSAPTNEEGRTVQFAPSQAASQNDGLAGEMIQQIEEPSIVQKDEQSVEIHDHSTEKSTQLVKLDLVSKDGTGTSSKYLEIAESMDCNTNTHPLFIQNSLSTYDYNLYDKYAAPQDEEPANQVTPEKLESDSHRREVIEEPAKLNTVEESHDDSSFKEEEVETPKKVHSKVLNQLCEIAENHTDLDSIADMVISETMYKDKLRATAKSPPPRDMTYTVDDSKPKVVADAVSISFANESRSFVSEASMSEDQSVAEESRTRPTFRSKFRSRSRSVSIDSRQQSRCSIEEDRSPERLARSLSPDRSLSAFEDDVSKRDQAENYLSLEMPPRPKTALPVSIQSKREWFKNFGHETRKKPVNVSSNMKQPSMSFESSVLFSVGTNEKPEVDEKSVESDNQSATQSVVSSLEDIVDPPEGKDPPGKITVDAKKSFKSIFRLNTRTSSIAGIRSRSLSHTNSRMSHQHSIEPRGRFHTIHEEYEEDEPASQRSIEPTALKFVESKDDASLEGLRVKPRRARSNFREPPTSIIQTMEESSPRQLTVVRSALTEPDMHFDNKSVNNQHKFNYSSKQTEPTSTILEESNPANDYHEDSSALSSTIETLEAENRDLKRQLASMMELLQETDASVAYLQEELRRSGSPEFSSRRERSMRRKPSRHSRHKVVRAAE